MKRGKTSMWKRTALMALALPVTLAVSACGKAIEPTKIMGIHWQCALVVDGDRSDSKAEFMFHRSGQVNIVLSPPRQVPLYIEALYKVDGSKFEYTQRAFVSPLTRHRTPIAGDAGPSFVGEFTRTESDHMAFDGKNLGGAFDQPVRADCTPHQ